MISRDDVKNLARLARIGVSEEEVERLTADLGSIVGYISELDTLDLGETRSAVGEHRNVFREDEHPHESGAHTSEILAVAAETKDGTIVVRQIIEK